MNNRVRTALVWTGAVFRLWILVTLLAAGLPSVAAEQRSVRLVPEPEFSEIAVAFAQKMPAFHLERMPLDDAVAARALHLFLAGLDGDRSFFLAADIERFRARVGELDDMLVAGDVSVAYEIVECFKERARERCDYVDKLLAHGFDLEKDEAYRWNRGDADVEWPAGRRRQNELWRQKIKDQYIRRLIAVELSDSTAAAKTNKTDEVGEGAPEKKPPLSAEEYISQQYRQFLTIQNDNESEWVFQQYLSAFARAFDPHSDYMSAGNVEDFEISMRLSLVGIGALLTSEDGAAKVVRVIPGGPAALDKRLQPGDKIVAVSDDGSPMQDVLHWPLARTVRLIRGKKGTKVALSLIPASDPAGTTTVTIELVRDDVRLEDQAAQGRTREVAPAPGAKKLKLGVIKLRSFYADIEPGAFASEIKSSATDVEKILRGMNAENVDGLVLDLRNNGGGSLSEAVSMTGLFIDTGPVVQMKDRRTVKVLRDEDPGAVYRGPLVILVNRMSASASEILAAALQDYGRAVIVGDSRTHGKGSVQSVISLRGRRVGWGSLKVTTASFYRFTGPSTQIRGVAADVKMSSPLDVMEVGEEYLDYAVPFSEIEPVDLAQQGTSNLLEDLLFWGGLRQSAAGSQSAVDLSDRVATLVSNSEARRAADKRFELRRALLDRFAARQAMKTVSLKLSERRALAGEERRLYELQQEYMSEGEDGGGAGESEEEDQKDLILQESLNILADLVGMGRAAGGEKEN